MHCLPYHHIFPEKQLDSAVIQCIPEGRSTAQPDEINQIIGSSLEIWVGNKQSRNFSCNFQHKFQIKYFPTKMSHLPSTSYWHLQCTQNNRPTEHYCLCFTHRDEVQTALRPCLRSRPFAAEQRHEPRFFTASLALKPLWSLSLLLWMTGRTMQNAVWKPQYPHLLQHLFLSPFAAVTNFWFTKNERVFPNYVF